MEPTEGEQHPGLVKTRIAPPASVLTAYHPDLSVLPPPVQVANLHRYSKEEMELEPLADLPTIDRHRIRAWHKELQDVIVQAVNHDGCLYRFNNNKVVLYPLNPGDPTFSVQARNNQRQARSLRQWYDQYVGPIAHPEKYHGTNFPNAEEFVTADPALAAVEQFVANGQAAQTAVDEIVSGYTEPEELTGGGKVEVEDPNVGEWVQHYGDNGDPVEGFVTNGLQWKCLICEADGNLYVTDHRTGIGGHRLKHTGTSSASLPVVQARRVDSMRYNKLAARIRNAVDELARSIDYAPAPDRLAVLERENVALRRRVADLEAKLALLREALDV